MRLWFSGPRIMGIRPGISLAPGDFTTKPTRGTAAPLKGSFVYVVKGDHNMTKIGVTTNPVARLSQLRTGSAFPIEYAFIGGVTGDGLDVEREAHRLLADKRVNGEWFDVPPELAISAVTGAAARLGRAVTLYDAPEIEPPKPGVIWTLWKTFEWFLLLAFIYWLAKSL